jgi:cell division protein FtsB
MKKRTIFRLFFALEIVVFGWVYMYGSNGLCAIMQLKQESAAIEDQIKLVQQEIQELQKTIIAWRSDPFYIEQFARENLHMAREGEIIVTSSGIR